MAATASSRSVTGSVVSTVVVAGDAGVVGC
jgi:hypothetical protein